MPWHTSTHASHPSPSRPRHIPPRGGLRRKGPRLLLRCLRRGSSIPPGCSGTTCAQRRGHTHRETERQPQHPVQALRAYTCSLSFNPTECTCAPQQHTQQIHSRTSARATAHLQRSVGVTRPIGHNLNVPSCEVSRPQYPLWATQRPGGDRRTCAYQQKCITPHILHALPAHHTTSQSRRHVSKYHQQGPGADDPPPPPLPCPRQLRLFPVHQVAGEAPASRAERATTRAHLKHESQCKQAGAVSAVSLTSQAESRTGVRQW